jgi:hypothetical protein
MTEMVWAQIGLFPLFPLFPHLAPIPPNSGVGSRPNQKNQKT